MIKELKYNGYTATPSDYECADGDLATSLNVVLEYGTLRPVLPPSEVLELASGDAVKYVHETSSFKHYIILNQSTNTLFWVDSTAASGYMTDANKIGNYYNISHINAVGNTLLVFTDTAIYYLLWKSGSYNVLGNKLPEIAISFGLIGHPRLYSLVTEDGSSSKRGTFSISFDKIGKNDLFKTFSDENKTKITSQVMAKVNKFIAEQTVNKGRFCFPFFVRWAYRLFDGSHVMHSAPILMTPSTTPAPVVIWNRATGDGSYTDAELDIMMVAADIDYSITSHADCYHLGDWQDIIMGIDIYISKPIYTYDQNGEFTSFSDDDNLECRFIGRLYNGEKDKNMPDTTSATDITEDRMLAPFTGTDFMSLYMEYTYTHIYCMYFSKDRTTPGTTLHMPEYSDEKRNESIESNSLFYKLAFIDINDMEVNTRKVIEIKDDYLQSLTTREVMTDDYLTHDRLMASYSYGFNSRLNLAGVKRELFNGFISNALFPFCQSHYSFEVDESNNYITITPAVFDEGNMRMRIYIRENGEVYYVENEPDSYLQYLRNFVCTIKFTSTTKFSDKRKRVIEYDYNAGTKKVTMYDKDDRVESTETFYNRYIPTAWASWLFYPNNNAFKIAIYEDFQLAFTCDLKAHDFLNGAYAFLGFKSERGKVTGTLPTGTQRNAIVDMPNKIYTSEVNNPFFFPLAGINTVGTGKIYGICAAAKALSEGQFGQFPLYAFTSDGVWAMEVSTTGTYSAKQPISRDVCIKPDSITQIDTAVLFATNRGIMLISGSQTQCITDSINAPELFSVADLPKPRHKGLHEGLVADRPKPEHDGLVSVFNRKASDHEQVDAADITFLPFLEFLAECGMVYDYTHQRIIVYNQKLRYAYVYSLKSQTWGMMLSDITDSVNSYPEALAMSKKKKTTTNEDGTEEETTVPVLVDFSGQSADSSTGLVITRPFKLDDPNVFKTIDTIIQRGFFKRENVQQVLYGSNDLLHWFPIWSSVDMYLRGFRGSPYKFFRLALVCKLDKSESLFGCTVQFNPRRLNQPR